MLEIEEVVKHMKIPVGTNQGVLIATVDKNTLTSLAPRSTHMYVRVVSFIPSLHVPPV